MFMAYALWVVAMAHSMSRERKVNRMDDLISRQAAIDALNGEFTITGRENAETIRNYINGVDKRLRELPSAERRGRWENIEHAPNGLLYATCSVCGRRQTVETTNYCGNCGSFNGEGEENAELQR